jgi:Zn-dependent protease
VGIVFSFLANFLLAYVLSQSGSAALFRDQAAATAGNSLMPLIVTSEVLRAISRANVALAFFNIIAVYPLDGAKILALKIATETQIKYVHYEKIFQLILIIALFTGWIGMILRPFQAVFVR